MPNQQELTSYYRHRATAISAILSILQKFNLLIVNPKTSWLSFNPRDRQSPYKNVLLSSLLVRNATEGGTDGFDFGDQFVANFIEAAVNHPECYFGGGDFFGVTTLNSQDLNGSKTVEGAFDLGYSDRSGTITLSSKTNAWVPVDGAGPAKVYVNEGALEDAARLEAVLCEIEKLGWMLDAYPEDLGRYSWRSGYHHYQSRKFLEEHLSPEQLEKFKCFVWEDRPPIEEWMAKHPLFPRDRKGVRSGLF